MTNYIDYIEAHDHCQKHRKEVLRSRICGCFYCMKLFHPEDIVDWFDVLEGETDYSKYGQTAQCPKCGIDSVIGDASGFTVDEILLEKMNRFWFSVPGQRDTL